MHIHRFIHVLDNLENLENKKTMCLSERAGLPFCCRQFVCLSLHAELKLSLRHRSFVLTEAHSLRHTIIMIIMHKDSRINPPQSHLAAVQTRPVLMIDSWTSWSIPLKRSPTGNPIIEFRRWKLLSVDILFSFSLQKKKILKYLVKSSLLCCSVFVQFTSEPDGSISLLGRLSRLPWTEEKQPLTSSSWTQCVETFQFNRRAACHISPFVHHLTPCPYVSRISDCPHSP